MTARTTEVATLTGLLDLADPDPAHISVQDIAHKLATNARWGRVLNPPLSVAQHSLMVAQQLPPRQRIYGLLHDAHEAYIGDITTPVETLLGRAIASFSTVLAQHKTALDAAIWSALDVPAPDGETSTAVHQADLRMAATEWISLMPKACGRNPIPAKPYRAIRVRAWAWPDAEIRFLEALQRELALRSWEN